MTKELFIGTNGKMDLRKVGSTAALFILLILQVIGMKSSNQEGINNLSKQLDRVEQRLVKLENLLYNQVKEQTALRVRLDFLEKSKPPID